MRDIRLLLPASLLILSTSTACDSPVGPSRQPAAPPPPAAISVSETSSSGLPGRPIAFGQTIEGELPSGAYPMCEFGNDPYPCGRYLLAVPRAGTVRVRLDFTGADEPMFIAFETASYHASRGNFVAVGGSPLTASYQTFAGHLTLAVGVDAPYGSRSSYRYRFVTTLE